MCSSAGIHGKLSIWKMYFRADPTTSISANLTHLTDAPLQPEHIFHLKIQTQ